MLHGYHRVKGDEPVYQLSEKTLKVIQSNLENAQVDNFKSLKNKLNVAIMLHNLNLFLILSSL
jgi:hypothetical protein